MHRRGRAVRTEPSAAPFVAGAATRCVPRCARGRQGGQGGRGDGCSRRIGACSGPERHAGRVQPRDPPLVLNGSEPWWDAPSGQPGVRGSLQRVVADDPGGAGRGMRAGRCASVDRGRMAIGALDRGGLRDRESGWIGGQPRRRPRPDAHACEPLPPPRGAYRHRAVDSLTGGYRVTRGKSIRGIASDFLRLPSLGAATCWENPPRIVERGA